jgi:hypothetical protein
MEKSKRRIILECITPFIEQLAPDGEKGDLYAFRIEHLSVDGELEYCAYGSFDSCNSFEEFQTRIHAFYGNAFDIVSVTSEIEPIEL